MTADFEKAASLLEQAVRVGQRDPATAYLLAMCHKQLGRHADACAVLARIPNPDANVHLQMGLLAFAQKDFVQAETCFARSFDAEPTSYAAGYDLLLAKLALRKRSESAALLGTLLPLAPNAGEQRFLSLLQTLLSSEAGGVPATAGNALATMSVDDEARLIEMIAGLGEADVVVPLLAMLAQLRPHSSAAQSAHFEAILAQGKSLLDDHHWKEAAAVLTPLLQSTPHAERIDPYARLALFCMLGTCACMRQDFERALWLFRSASELFQKELQAAEGSQRRRRQFNSQGIYEEAWLQQNLALAHEWNGSLDKAEQHWNRYFDYLEYDVDNARPDQRRLDVAFEGLHRLADLFTRKEKWHTALAFLQRAHKIRPTDPEVLERLFHLYDQLRKPEEARKILRRLRDVRPDDPQLELFELDVREVRDLDDLERFFGDLRRLLQKNAGNLQVEERAAALLVHTLPLMEGMYDQWSSQLARVTDQMRRLPSYQINWPVVRQVSRELEEKFVNLRRVANRNVTLARGDARRDIQRLVTQCERRIQQCHDLGD